MRMMPSMIRMRMITQHDEDENEEDDNDEDENDYLA